MSYLFQPQWSTIIPQKNNSYVFLLFQFFSLCGHGIQLLMDVGTGIVFFVQQVLAKVFKSLEGAVPGINFCTVFLSNTNFQDMKVWNNFLYSSIDLQQFSQSQDKNILYQKLHDYSV